MAIILCVVLSGVLCFNVVLCQFSFLNPQRDDQYARYQNYGQGFLNIIPDAMRRIPGTNQPERPYYDSHGNYFVFPNNERRRPQGFRPQYQYDRYGRIIDQYGNVVNTNRPGNNFGQPGNNFGQPGNNFGQSGNNFGQPGNNFGQPGNNFGQPGNNFVQFGQTNNFGRPQENQLAVNFNDNSGSTSTSTQRYDPNQDHYIFGKDDGKVNMPNENPSPDFEGPETPASNDKYIFGGSDDQNINSKDEKSEGKSISTDNPVDDDKYIFGGTDDQDTNNKSEGKEGNVIIPNKDQPLVTPVPNGDQTSEFPVFEPVPTSLPKLTPVPTGLPQLTPVATGLSQLTPVSTGLPQLTPVAAGLSQLTLVPTGLPQLTPVATGLPQLTPVPTGLPHLTPVATGLPQLTPVPTYLPQLTPVPTGLPELTPVPNLPETDLRFNVFQPTCDTDDGGVGSCILVNSCPEFVAVLKQVQVNPQAAQRLRRAHCGFQGNSSKVCCPHAPIVTPSTVFTTTVTETPVAPIVTVAPVGPVDGSVFPLPPVCGSVNITVRRVVGGIPAKLGQFPWMANLGYQNQNSTTPFWLCGGSLISARHVLTAAHCIHDHEKDLYMVRLGELDLSRDDDGATPTDVRIQEKYKHEDYNAKAFTDDIGILLLERVVEFTALIRPICMPLSESLRANTFVDYNPFIAGWGGTSFHGPSASHLQLAQVPVVTTDACKNAYIKYKKKVIDNRVLCAGYTEGGIDACQGDSGGPLMQPMQTDWKFFYYQIGVVSFGRKCAEKGFPGVYSRVTHFVPWIERTVSATMNL